MTCRLVPPIMQRVGRFCQFKDGSVRFTKSLQILLVLTAASGVSAAMAQGRSQERSAMAMSLFGAAPIDSPKGEIRGMRPETIGEVAYFSLSVDAPNKLRGLTSSSQQQVEIPFPGAASVPATLGREGRPKGGV